MNKFIFPLFSTLFFAIACSSISEKSRDEIIWDEVKKLTATIEKIENTKKGIADTIISHAQTYDGIERADFNRHMHFGHGIVITPENYLKKIIDTETPCTEDVCLMCRYVEQQKMKIRNLNIEIKQEIENLASNEIVVKISTVPNPQNYYLPKYYKINVTDEKTEQSYLFRFLKNESLT